MVLLCYACSSDDDSNDNQMMDPTLEGHYMLRINGNGFNDDLFLFDNDTINPVGSRIVYSSSSNSNDYLSFYLPTIEEGTYNIIPYVNGENNIASITIHDNGIYLCEDGSITISEVTNNFELNCLIVKGNLNINFRRQDNASGNINVSGTFDVPSYNCE